MGALVKKLEKNWLILPALIVSIWILFPIIWLFLSSIQPVTDLFIIPPKWIPTRPTLKYYTAILFEAEIGTRGLVFRNSFLNSLIIALGTTIITIAFGSLAAYSFSRSPSRFRNSAFFSLLGSQMIPEIVFIIPLYFIYTRTNIIDTHAGVILVHCAILLPYVTWIMKGFFDSLPIEYEESARVDGCSRLDTILRIVLPLSTPGLAACAVFVFIESWNEFFFAFMLTNVKAVTLQSTMGSFMGRYSVEYEMMFATAVLSILPIIILAIALQKYLVKGLTEGGLKI